MARCGSPTSTASCASAQGRWDQTRSEELDSWLASLVGDEPDVALVAVGSYGRGDAADHSDLDLVLLYRGRRRDVRSVADRVWYPIWDRGIKLDHSVRTVKDALAVADRDLKAMLGLLDARWVGGDADLARDLTSRAVEQWQARAKRWLPRLRAAMVERHARFGEVAYLLEPELKEGRGGLRDVHALWAAARAVPEVLADGIGAVAEPHAALRDVRRALHRRAGRALDTLLLQEQDGVAIDLGLLDADALMAYVSEAARAIAYASDEGWERVDAFLSRGKHRQDMPNRDPDDWLGAAVEAARTGVPLGRATLRRFESYGPPPPNPWTEAWRHNLVALLGAGSNALPVLEALDQHGLLVRLLPEWEAVRNRPQRNAYHRFTVDRHLWEAAANAAAHTRQVSRPDLLLVGALLHDIGKGFPGDHTEAGIEQIRLIGPRLGFRDEDVDVLEAMVRHHLLLADVATRRDLDDPATIERVARAVGDVETLALLAALTEADSLATGPSAWSDWKANLVAELVARTRILLLAPESGVRTPDWGVKTAEVLEAAADLPLGLHGAGNECTVVAYDRPGLFSNVSGVLALHGLDVRSATVGSSSDGRAVEVIEVEPAFGKQPRWAAVASDYESVLDGTLSLDDKLSERARNYSRRYRTSAARPADPRVIVDNRASDRATVLEVRAPDGVAVLYRITTALAQCGLDVRVARVSTLGHEVVDAFYVVDGDGGKVTDGEKLAEVETAILSALSAA